MSSSKRSGRKTESEDSEGEGSDPQKVGRGRAIWDQVSTLLIAIVIALTIRAFVIEPFRIPSGSMLPTLLIGDHLFVNKFIYGPRIPFTEIRLPGFRMPERGDVVVFEVARNDGSLPGVRQDISPADQHPELPRDDFVKRLVGLPGDRIQIRDGRVTVNGVPAEQIATGETFEGTRGTPLVLREEVLGDCVHPILEDPISPSPWSRRGDFVVPEGRYFMMGDNRDKSNDSRSWGTVRFEEMKGPAFILYWSWDVNGNALQFFNPINWFTAEKRWDRFMKPVSCESPEELAARTWSPAENSLGRD
ncbi:MAG: signal peptidase I [Deltaproteobacteria bacterium]|nr:signal peptidase I [Deltaproteobacteria bacterium]